MVNQSIISAKLAHINNSLERLRGKSAVSRELFLEDIDLQDIILHNLQNAIQGCVDLASHIVSDEGWTIPSSIAELFDILKEKKVIGAKTAELLKKMAGFRNIIVHEYEDVDLLKVYDIFSNHLDDFTGYIQEIVSFTKF